jgi:hypothetical protein
MPIELFELPWIARRRYCECCGFPTLGIPDDRDGAPDWEGSATACDLCEWDSAPLGVDGEPRPSSDEERNDGLALDAARQRLERHGSIYDPADPPPWKLSAPSAHVVDARAALRASYAAVLDVPLAERGERWELADAAERELAAAMAAQREQDEALANDAFADDVLADDALMDGAP